MNARLSAPPVPGGAQALAWRTGNWVAGVAPERPEVEQGAGLGMGVFALVLFAHLVVLAVIATQTLTISTPEQSSAGSGPLRVRLVSSKPEPAVPPQAVQPPPPPPHKPEKKILASEAPSSRVVEAAKTKPDPVPVQQVAAAPPDPAPASPAPAAAVATPGPAVANAGKPDALDLGSAPKEVGQIDCSVPKPEYPRSARRRGASGTVSIRLTVDERGQVSAVLDRSSGFPDLDASARQAALAAQCKPYREGGRAIRVTALQPFQFVPSN